MAESEIELRFLKYNLFIIKTTNYLPKKLDYYVHNKEKWILNQRGVVELRDKSDKINTKTGFDIRIVLWLKGLIWDHSGNSVTRSP